jgi:uncharacterized protein with GYD domain
MRKEETTMPIYVTLFKWTDQGVKNIKEAATRIEESTKAAAGLGGKVLGVYVTLGEYDLVSISEWPNDESAATTALAISSRGNARTTTMRAFTAKEFAEMAKKLP